MTFCSTQKRCSLLWVKSMQSIGCLIFSGYSCLPICYHYGYYYVSLSSSLVLCLVFSAMSLQLLAAQRHSTFHRMWAVPRVADNCALLKELNKLSSNTKPCSGYSCFAHLLPEWLLILLSFLLLIFSNCPVKAYRGVSGPDTLMPDRSIRSTPCIRNILTKFAPKPVV